jgi:Antirestriction protein
MAAGALAGGGCAALAQALDATALADNAAQSLHEVGVSRRQCHPAASGGGRYDSPLYATYKQIQDQGGQVRRGEHGVPIIVWKEWTPSAPQEGSGKPLGPEDRVPGVDPRLAQSVEQGNGMAEPRRRGFAKVYRVCNLAQTDGLDALLNQAAPEAAWDHNVAGRLFLERLREIGVQVEQGLGDRAYCQPGEGRIVMPAEGRFATPSAYYGTLLHEAIHSSKNTLQRPDWYAARGMDPDQAYAAEELVAELGMLLLARRLNVPIAPEDTEQTASYLKGWTLRAAVEENPRLLYQTARLAQAAVDHLAAPEFVLELEALQKVQKTGPGQTQTPPGSLREPAPQAPEFPRLSIDIDAGERYTFHGDAGHGWLEVPRSDLKALDIDGLINVFSYQKGNRVFLEEDRDALLFHRALEKVLGRDLKPEDFSREVFDGDDPPFAVMTGILPRIGVWKRKARRCPAAIMCGTGTRPVQSAKPSCSTAPIPAKRRG